MVTAWTSIARAQKGEGCKENGKEQAERVQVPERVVHLPEPVARYRMQRWAQLPSGRG